MSVEANKQVVLKFIEGMTKGNFDEALLGPDARWWVPGRGYFTLPQFKELAGHFTTLLKTPVEMKVHGITAEGDRVAVEAESFAELNNGKSYNNTYHFLFELKDGKIVLSKEYNDSLHAYQSMGFG